MTREEAIRCFEKLLLHVDTNAVMGIDTTEAINMAIKALEQETDEAIGEELHVTGQTVINHLKRGTK